MRVKLIRSDTPKAVRCLTAVLFANVAGVPQKLEGLLEAQGMLGGAVRGFNVVNESGHFPLGLTGGWGQKALVALIQGTGTNSVSYCQHRDLHDRTAAMGKTFSSEKQYASYK